MNERIRLLAEQAEKYALDNVGKGHYGIEDLIYQFQFADTKMAKFAELIIRECASLAYRESCYSDPENVMGFDISKKIEEYFGVKE